MRVLDLFSGIGGFSLGLERAGMRTVAFCEIDPYCRAVLARHWPGVPIHEDIRTLDAGAVGPIDVICGGYPCQPFSFAGKRAGAEDDRHLWPEYRRLVEALRPSWVIGENVAGHITMGLDDVLSDLEALGYACRPFVIPACAVDAKHRRDRVWVIAHAHRQGEPAIAQHGDARRGLVGTVAYAQGEQRDGSRDSRSGRDRPSDGREAMADAERQRQPGPRAPWDASHPTPAGEGEAANAFDGGLGDFWSPEPGVGRVANGIPSRMDRLRALGNSVVPQVVQAIGEAIMTAEAA